MAIHPYVNEMQTIVTVCCNRENCERQVDRGALVGTNVGELCQNRELCQITRPSKPCNPDHKQVVLSGMPEDLPWGLIIEPALRDLSPFFPV